MHPAKLNIDHATGRALLTYLSSNYRKVWGHIAVFFFWPSVAFAVVLRCVASALPRHEGAAIIPSGCLFCDYFKPRSNNDLTRRMSPQLYS